MAKTALRLDKRRMLKDGTYPVQVKVGFGTNLYLSTGIYLKEDEWEARTQMCIGKMAKKVNLVLGTILVDINSHILDLMERGVWSSLSKSQVRQLLTGRGAPAAGGLVTLGKVFDMMMEGRKENSKSMVRSTRVKIKEYCGQDADSIVMDDVTRSWVEDFERSMSGLAVNTRCAYLKTVRRAFNYAIDRDMTKNYPFKRFRIKEEETRMRVLTVGKMRKLMTMDLPKGYDEYRDFFMLTFYLIGINTVDLSELRHSDVVDGRIEYRRAKTGKLYSIKVEPEAAAILEKYKGKTHLLRMFDGRSDYKSYQGTCNSALARMGDPVKDAAGKEMRARNGRVAMVPLQDGLSLYWARYSWATYAADLDVPTDTISEALGHSHGAKVTGIYVKYNRDKVDEANRRVIDYVLHGVK
ncbi:MAG: phage integrase SAM-like domain-containing protein [Prevotella sp.]